MYYVSTCVRERMCTCVSERERTGMLVNVCVYISVNYVCCVTMYILYECVYMEVYVCCVSVCACMYESEYEHMCEGVCMLEGECIYECV